MNRSKYFDFIEKKLSELVTSIELRGRLNITNNHLHSENFYQHFFKLIFNYQLIDLNTQQHNASAIDLIDNSQKIILQVSATATTTKINSTLDKLSSKYNGYHFRFVAIKTDVQKLKTVKYTHIDNLRFSPTEDIIDVSTILKLIKQMQIDQLETVFNFIKKELKSEPDPLKIETNLATIINILSKENWNDDISKIEVIPYDIEEKILYNRLQTAKSLINDHKIHYPRIEKIYSEFDKQGANKSYSVLNGIRTIYHDLMINSKNTLPDQCFLLITEQIYYKVLASDNYSSIPEEELQLCVQILVVDAFIRCKIFENPSGKTNANP